MDPSAAPSAGALPCPPEGQSTPTTHEHKQKPGVEEGLLQGIARTWQSWGWNPGLQMFLGGPKLELSTPTMPSSSERVSYALGQHSTRVQPEPVPSQLTWLQGWPSRCTPAQD